MVIGSGSGDDGHLPNGGSRPSGNHPHQADHSQSLRQIANKSNGMLPASNSVSDLAIKKRASF